MEARMTPDQAMKLKVGDRLVTKRGQKIRARFGGLRTPEIPVRSVRYLAGLKKEETVWICGRPCQDLELDTDPEGS